ncbi:MAG TPA: DAK2 domain-containing protein [Firmicutes bacterium]|nr:DAK2 domain-containing protein [Bacillota bacterium]
MGLEREWIGGSLFRSMIFQAATLLNQKKAEIDFLNVYPVPDGDTGTNMALTLLAAAREVERCASDSVGDLAAAAAKGSLMGARGNSGVILSQLLRGLARPLQNKDKAGVPDLARALQEASATAYKAVMRPVEGTMLTVARFAAEAGRQAARKETDIVKWWQVVLEAAERGLAETQKMLPALAEAGVVDAGGQGIVVIMEGVYAALEAPVLAAVPSTGTAFEISVGEKSRIQELKAIEFRYCTELIIRGEEIALDALREKLAVLGDSLLVVGDGDTAKVHVHTNRPGQVLEICGEYGEMLDIKIDNMSEQNREVSRLNKLAETNGRKPSSAAEVGNNDQQRSKTLEKEIGVVAVALGSGWKAIFEGLGVDVVLNGGQTMNPSTEELIDAIVKVPAGKVIVLPNNKNVVFAAEQAAKVVDKEVAVIHTPGLQHGAAAAAVYDEGLGFRELVAKMESASQAVVSGEVTYAVRNTTTNGIKVNERDYIGLHQGKVLVAGQDLAFTTKELIRKLLAARRAEIVSLFYGRDVVPAAAEELLRQLQAEFPEPEWELYEGGQPLYYYLVAVE